ncbi:NAD(P)-binding domain-containing protein [Gammaproteobacteria bacterium]|nr:NAD(P)-binding domain-containing protein [Gammaproteobacteria bacterium]
MKIGIVEPKDFSKKVEDFLRSIGQVFMFDKSSEDLESFISDKDVIFIRLEYFYSEQLLCYAKNLKYICSPTTGLNHIDLQYVKDSNIQIISLKGEVDFLNQITATSEHTFGLVISLLRFYKRAFTEKNLTNLNRDLLKGYEINSSKIGIIGLGRIGSHLVNYFNAFGAHIYYYDIDDSKEHLIAKKCSSIESLIEASDVIILSASYSSKNKKMIGRQRIDMMKEKFFINTSRGELVDEEYLLDRIKEGFFSGVAIDVFNNEQGFLNNKEKIMQLTTLDLNFISTPHMGGATLTSMAKTEDFIAKKLELNINQPELSL